MTQNDLSFDVLNVFQKKSSQWIAHHLEIRDKVNSGVEQMYFKNLWASQPRMP